LFGEHLGGANKDLKWSDKIQDLGSRRGNEQHPPRLRVLLIII
jgi:hypothetical protein